MTRKRFKKLLMGVGFGRNKAEGFSWLACALCESYAAAWSAICLGLEARAAEGVGSAVSGAAVKRAAEGVGSAVSGAAVGPYGEEAPKCE